MTSMRPHREVDFEMPKELTIRVKLKDFVIPNTAQIPEEVRSKVKKWSEFDVDVSHTQSHIDGQ
jgi:hypothetical protein